MVVFKNIVSNLANQSVYELSFQIKIYVFTTNLSGFGLYFDVGTLVLF